ncbi:50S ribosomal protein L29 [ANME-2 cluster archaeon]|nr:50S ribosomal protein L29 [Methanosarcinales archaeon]RJS73099.1 MAG: 50S ribosomal protein L29 [ANME-2 cluster archaeon]RLG24239.1 MAG: 50S ribosomal protein L29 [Methanosarcinales archaeon]
MALLRSEEIRNMSLHEMLDELESLRMDLIRERALVSTGGAPENPGLIRELRRTIARIKTIQKEKRL